MSLARALGHEVGSSPMSDGTPIVFVVDDDVSVRESLELLIRCEGWQPEIFASAQEFLSRPRVLVPSCLILDVSLPGLNGLDLQKRIASDRIDMPFVILRAAITCISLHLAVLDTKVCQAKLSRDGGRVRDLSAQCRSTPR
jgi:CheY-like chemotaxis protein